MLVAAPGLTFPLTAALFVGSGVGLAYGTLFAGPGRPRPVLPVGSTEEALWLHDELDRVAPTRTDWLLTGALLLPSVGLTYLGVTAMSGAGLVAAGLTALLGPVWAAGGLLVRSRQSRSLRARLAELDAKWDGARIG